MSLVLGIDPGGDGAFALYNSITRTVVGEIRDMPLWFQTVGRRKRKRVDALAIRSLFETYKLMGVDLVVMEAVGGRTGQGAAAGFAFGYGVGMIYMAVMYAGIPLDTVQPATWKAHLKVPGKAAADDSAIYLRACELLPDAQSQFLGPKGGKKIDRAEAALIAKFGGDVVLNNFGNVKDLELEITYRNADTGG